MSWFFKTGPTDASGKSNLFYCRICRKYLSVMTLGVYEILGHYKGTKHFPRDQRFRLETPGWRLLDLEGNPMRKEEVEWQRKWIWRAPQAVEDREYPFQWTSPWIARVHLTSVFPCLPRFRFWLKHCVRAPAMDCSISSALSSL